MNKDHPCYQCPGRFPGCSGSCQRPEYLEEKRKAEAIKDAMIKQKTKDSAFTTYAVEVARKKNKRFWRKK